jgi:hypothetical protein
MLPAGFSVEDEPRCAADTEVLLVRPIAVDHHLLFRVFHVRYEALGVETHIESRLGLAPRGRLSEMIGRRFLRHGSFRTRLLPRCRKRDRSLRKVL